LNLWPFFVKEQRLVGSYSRTREDLQTTLAWAVEGRLRPVLDRVLPLADAAAGLAALRARTVLGKIVVAP
jgi:alcohol dehydrogenase